MKKERTKMKIRYIATWQSLLFFVVVSFIFSGCQDEAEEITPPPADKVILPNSAVATYIRKIAMHDGSVDNIIDHASCISLVLPVTVIVNNEEVTIDSLSDLSDVEEILDEVEGDADTVQLLYPVTAVLADHTQVTVQNEGALEALRNLCTEGGSDDDIECVDFQYPLTLSVYDSENQLARTVTLQDDEELHDFFDNLDEDEFAGFQFPIAVVLDGTETLTITNNIQLEDAIESSLAACDEDDDSDHNDDDADDTAFIEVLVTGQWQVAQFQAESDQTSAFAGIAFTFNADGTVAAAGNGSTAAGVWETDGDGGWIELEMYLGEEAPFDELHEDWRLIEFSGTLIKLMHVSDEDGSVTTLVFEKK